MATKIFVNSKEMEAYFDKIMKEIVEAVSQDLLKDFLKHLDSTIYAAPKGEEYQRLRENGGFYSGWIIQDEQKKEIGKYVKSLAFKGNRLALPTTSNNLAHGGVTGGDQRGKMAWILNDLAANYDYSYNGGAKYLTQESGNSIGYWTSYLKNWEKQVDKLFNKELKKYGIQRG